MKPSDLKSINGLLPILIFTLFISPFANAVASTFTSAGSGSWSTPATWTVSGGNAGSDIPTASDDVIILSGHTIDITAPGTIASLRVTGTLNVNIPNGILKTNNVVANNGATTGNINITSGNLRVEKLINLTNLLVTIDGASSSVTYGEDKDFIRTNEYIRVKNSGKLILENIGKGSGSVKRDYNLGNITFPIGTSDGTTFSYTPVLINNRDSRPATIRATIAVTVSNGVLRNGYDGAPIATNAVNRTWSVNVLYGDADLEAYFYWNQPNELPSFNPVNSMVALYSQGVWDMNVPTSLNPTARVASIAGLTNIVTGQVSLPTTFPLMSIVGGGINPLPVELVNFNAVKKNSEVALTWETASEKNNTGFEVQSSMDGKNFEKIGFVASQNNTSSSLQRYAFTDKVSNKEGMVYYRLKQIDLDGTVAFYNAKVVDLGRFSYVATAYPNPFQNAFKLSLEAPASGHANLVVTDLTGKVVYAGNQELLKGQNTLEINLKDVPTGLYLLKAATGSQTYMKTLLKQ